MGTGRKFAETLLRFSRIKHQLYAPEEDGRLDTDSGVGQLLQTVLPGEQGDPSGALINYVTDALDPVPAGSPVVFMVRGFDFDPLDDPAGDPGETENPHGRLFHFGGDDPQAHAVSWPRRFGFLEDDGRRTGSTST